MSVLSASVFRSGVSASFQPQQHDSTSTFTLTPAPRHHRTGCRDNHRGGRYLGQPDEHDYSFSHCEPCPTPNFTLSASPSSLDHYTGANRHEHNQPSTSAERLQWQCQFVCFGLPSGVRRSYQIRSATPPPALTPDGQHTATTGASQSPITGHLRHFDAYTSFPLTVRLSPHFLGIGPDGAYRCVRGGGERQYATLSSR